MTLGMRDDGDRIRAADDQVDGLSRGRSVRPLRLLGWVAVAAILLGGLWWMAVNPLYGPGGISGGQSRHELEAADFLAQNVRDVSSAADWYSALFETAAGVPAVDVRSGTATVTTYLGSTDRDRVEATRICAAVASSARTTNDQAFPGKGPPVKIGLVTVVTTGQATLATCAVP